MQAVFDNWNAKALEVFIAGFTDAGLVSVFGEDGQTVDELKVGLANFIGSDPVTEVTIANTEASGTTATTEAQFALGGAFEKNAYTFVKVGDAWKVDSETPLVVDVPEGKKLVNVDANEFSFVVDINEIGDGDVAFELANVGTQPHELVLFRIPADLVVEDLVQQFAESGDSEDPPGVEFAGAVAAEPNETFNLVLAEQLASGRYQMVCFLPDLDEGEEGTAHALKGMTKEFTIE